LIFFSEQVEQTVSCCEKGQVIAKKQNEMDGIDTFPSPNLKWDVEGVLAATKSL